MHSAILSLYDKRGRRQWSAFYCSIDSVSPTLLDYLAHCERDSRDAASTDSPSSPAASSIEQLLTTLRMRSSKISEEACRRPARARKIERGRQTTWEHGRKKVSFHGTTDSAAPAPRPATHHTTHIHAHTHTVQTATSFVCASRPSCHTLTADSTCGDCMPCLRQFGISSRVEGGLLESQGWGAWRVPRTG